ADRDQFDRDPAADGRLADLRFGRPGDRLVGDMRRSADDLRAAVVGLPSVPARIHPEFPARRNPVIPPLSHVRLRNEQALASLSGRTVDLRPGMQDSYIIEVSSRAAGIVLRDHRGYRFFAASKPFYRLDGRLFRHVSDAQ